MSSCLANLTLCRQERSRCRDVSVLRIQGSVSQTARELRPCCRRREWPPDPDVQHKHGVPEGPSFIPIASRWPTNFAISADELSNIENI